jgi:uncharacterized protein (TIGR03086 family)
VDIIDRYERAADGFTARLDAVGDDQWASRTPCTDWDVRRLVDHVIDVQRAIPEGLGMAVTDVPDPKATWKAVRDGAMTVLRQPGVLEQTMPGRSGEMPVEMSLGIRVGDLLVHTWDLARATGGDEQLDADTAALVLERIKPNDELLRSSGTFGPKLDPPPGADAAVELLCFTGRRP